MFMCSKGFLKIQLFHRYFEKILPKHSRMLTERSTPFSDTCLKFTAIFCEIVIIFLGRNTPNNKFLDVTNKETKKVTWRRCWSPSTVNLDQLIFTRKGWHLVLALFASKDFYVNSLFLTQLSSEIISLENALLWPMI